jgi:hypothetical protein
MEEQKIAPEVAEAEFERFVAAMDFDIDAKSMANEEERAAFATTKRTIVRAMECGHLIINEKGEPVYTPQLGDQAPITFFEPSGVSLMAMESKKKGQDVSKMFATLGDMTRTSVARFAALKQRDLRVCMALATLFLS